MRDIESEVRDYLTERNWDRPRPADIAKSVCIEAAELLELFQWENRDLEDVKGDEKACTEIQGELADVLIYAIEMAVLLDLDTKAIIREKLEHTKKKYPAEAMREAQKHAPPGTNPEYARIKKEYRNGGGV